MHLIFHLNKIKWKFLVCKGTVLKMALLGKHYMSNECQNDDKKPKKTWLSSELMFGQSKN